MTTCAVEPVLPLLGDTRVGIPGLVWAYRFDATGRATGLPFPVEADVLDKDFYGDGSWLWLHFAQSDARAAAFMATLALPARAINALLARDDHVSLHLEGNTAFGVLADWQHALEDEFATATARPSDDCDIGRLHFALADRFVVSTRRRALRSVNAVRCGLDAGARLESPSHMLESIVGHFAESVAEVTRELADALDSIEDRILSDRTGDERRDLGKLRRRAVRMHRPLKALRRVTSQFEQRHQRRSDHPMVEASARVLQRFDELDTDIVIIQDRAKLLHDEVSAKLTDQTNRHLYFLSILTALFLPPTLVVGVFGMNTKGLPLTDTDSGFAIAIAICVAASAVVYTILRRRGIR